MQKIWYFIFLWASKHCFTFVDVVKGKDGGVHAVILTNHETFLEDIEKIEPR